MYLPREEGQELVEYALILVLVAAVGVGQQLLEQTGHQIDGGPYFRGLLQQHRHSPVVLSAVEANPRHGIFRGDVVGITR